MSRLSVEIPDSLHQQIKAQASLQGLSLREYVLQRLGFASGRKNRQLEMTAAPAGGQPGQRAEPGTIRELLENRPWQGTMTKAEIDAYIAEERASWNDD
ncbi:hypothetical protein RM531_12125 [Salinisphaera sp. P385]|uniref:Antitoxin ParD n=1 Tax=Spectribacter acetivorans TaxID=3075603 RepID=A0ABU3B9T7_9GAMM|nr:hypothetical protein [Salinisphaera sp. P385]MDT0619223.1 hypothetical protein [Salinisphaera sp. P385]